MGSGDDSTLERVTQAELNVIIRKHILFQTARPGGARAVLRDRDLSGLTFLGQNLSQSDFTGCILAGADLSNANFESATLFGCDFTGAKLTNTRLVRADMRGANVGEADLSKADMTGADLREGKTLVKRRARPVSNAFLPGDVADPTQFTGSDMTGAVLNGATATNADFTDAVLLDAKMQGANLKNAVLKGADLSNADLSGSDIRGADFSYATMSGAKLDNAEKTDSKFTLTLTGEPAGKPIEEFALTLDELILMHMTWIGSAGRNGRQLILNQTDMRKGPGLSGKRLTAIKAFETVFAEMDLRGIEMQGATLEKCDFRKGNMISADLRGTNFSSCLFNRADLSKANLGPLTIKKPDGVEFKIPCNFSQGQMRHVVFAGARLAGANFAGADLSEADFTNCDLRGANFTGALVEKTNFDGAILEDVKGLAKPQ